MVADQILEKMKQNVCHIENKQERSSMIKMFNNEINYMHMNNNMITFYLNP